MPVGYNDFGEINPMLGQVLRQYREARGWKQDALAAKTGLAQSYISRIERGERTNVPLETLRLFADALQVPLDELVRASMPEKVAALRSVGVPDKYLQEMSAKWEDLTLEDQELLLIMTRTLWERRQVRNQSQLEQKPGNPQPAMN